MNNSSGVAMERNDGSTVIAEQCVARLCVLVSKASGFCFRADSAQRPRSIWTEDRKQNVDERWPLRVQQIQVRRSLPAWISLILCDHL